MADQKISALTAIDGATLASTDLAVVVDVSDTTMNASGTDKKITVANLATAITSVGSLATDTEVAAAVTAHVAASDPHTQYAQESALATIATSGSASDLTAGTVPTARLGSGTANAGTFLRGDRTFSTPPSVLDAGLGSALPWAPGVVIGPELWTLSGLITGGGGTNTATLSPSVTSNSTNQTVRTVVYTSTNVGTCFRLTGQVTSMSASGWVSINMLFVNSDGSVVTGTNKQRLFTNGSPGPLGWFQFEFTPPGLSYFAIEIEVTANSTTGVTSLGSMSLKEISHCSKPILYGDLTATNGTGIRIHVPLYDSTARRWKMARQIISADGNLTLGLAGIDGFNTDRPFVSDYPELDCSNATPAITADVGGATIGLYGNEIQRLMRIGNNDQILEVKNGSGNYELRGNTHGGETNTTPAVIEVDRGDGSWITWDHLGLQLRQARRLRFTWPTTMQISDAASPFASVSHVTTYFPDGVCRTDRSTTFTAAVRLRKHFEWMTSHDLQITKIGRMGHGLVVLDEVDIHPLLVAPASPSMSTATSGGTLAAATYGYTVTTITDLGESTPTALVTQITTGSTSANTVSWTAVTNAAGYRIYGRSSTVNRQTLLAVVAGSVTSWVDDGSVVPQPGVTAPDVNRARRDVVSTNVASGVAASNSANWAGWYDLQLGLAFANIYDRDAVLARPQVASSQCLLQSISGSIVKNYELLWWVGDGNVDNNFLTQPITSGTVWTATHWSVCYAPADRVNWHTEAAIKSMDLAKLKDLYPAT